MLSETISRPSLPSYEALRASHAELLTSPRSRARLQRLARRLDVWAAFAVVALTTSAVWYAGTWLIERWQLR